MGETLGGKRGGVMDTFTGHRRDLCFYKIKKHEIPKCSKEDISIDSLPFFLSPIIVHSVSAIVIVEESFFRLCSKSHCSISTKNVALSSSTKCWRSRGRLERYSGPIWTPLFSKKRKWRRHVKIKKTILCIRTLEIQKQTLEKS